MAKKKEKLTSRNVAPVVDNQNTITAGKRGPVRCRMSGIWRRWPTSTER